MKTKITPDWLEATIVESGILEAFVRLDPHDENYFVELIPLLDQAGKFIWAQISATLGSDNITQNIRNVWALASSNPQSIAAIIRCIPHSGDSETNDLQLIGRLKSSLMKSDVNQLSWLYFLAGINDSFETLEPSQFTAAFKARFELAKLSHSRCDTAKYLSLAAKIPRLSRLAYQRELKRSFTHSTLCGNAWRKLSLADFKALPLDQQFLVAEDPALVKSCLDQDVLSSGAHFEAVSNRNQLINTKKALKAISGHILRLDYKSANKVAERIESVSELESVGLPYKNRYLRNIFHPERHEFSDYEPLSSHLLEVISLIIGKRNDLKVFGMSASDAAIALAKRKVAVSNIPSFLFSEFKSNWNADDIETLLVAKRFDVIPEIPHSLALKYFKEIVAALSQSSNGCAEDAVGSLVDANEAVDECVEILSSSEGRNLKEFLLSWMDLSDSADSPLYSRLIDGYGTRVADRFINDQSIITIKRLLERLRNGSEVQDDKAFKEQIAPKLALGISHSSHSDRDQWLKAAEGFISTYPDLQQRFLNGFSSSDVFSILSFAKAPTWLEDLFKTRDDYKTIQLELATETVKGSKSSEKIIAALETFPDLVKFVTADTARNVSESRCIASIAVSILAFRRDAPKLKNYSRELPHNDFRSAAITASRILPSRSRERAFLELLSATGARYSKLLAAVMASMKREAAAGCKLNHLYHCYDLPKDSGGKRPIAAPVTWLKLLQRALLDTILTPLGSHHAAYGFVRGRSITSNAAEHVSKPVVVNCDISNCFPNTRWSLVLHALRRDLSEKYCEATISLLVDICTMSGGLPIGAPTSPALLNRVLYQSDEWLSNAARDRKCSYTRYADDLTFSGDDKAVGMLAIARKTLAGIGFTLDKKKTNIYRAGRRQIVTGLVVNDRVSVPRRLRRRIRAAVHALENGKEIHWMGHSESRSALQGRVAFLKSVNQEEGNKLLRRLKLQSDND